jgi:hypothetical protein
MVQVLMALAVVAALVYFVLFRSGSQPEAEDPRPHAAELQKAEQVEDVIQQGQQLEQQRIDEQTGQ